MISTRYSAFSFQPPQSYPDLTILWIATPNCKRLVITASLLLRPCYQVSPYIGVACKSKLYPKDASPSFPSRLWQSLHPGSRKLQKQSVNSMQARVLIIDDDFGLLRLLGHVFSNAGYRVYTATNGREGIRQLHDHSPDLVILDVMMPVMDGWQTCSYIRRLSATPVILLTAVGWEDDVVRGLEGGAVDYITKPFSSKVLLARARAALRRAKPPLGPEQRAIYDDGYLAIDLHECRVLVRGQPVKLTATEHRLLAYLLQNAGKLLSPRQILEHVWGWTREDDTDGVRGYIRHLRQKLEQDPKNPQYVLTEHGAGYWFQVNPHPRNAPRDRLGEQPRLAQTVP